LARIESQLGKLDQRIASLHATMAEAAADHVRVSELNSELRELHARQQALEEEWLTLAED
jgi:predicted  nucleic acid-binding Zn-ribbon protein